MSQEHLFCAEIYHLLYGHIDHSRPIRFCLDGSAAARFHKKGVLADSCLPDFCFFFVGGRKEFRVEAKIVKDGEVTFYGPGQPSSWHRSGGGRLKPVLWIGTDADMAHFFLWEHAAFDGALAPVGGEGLTSNKTKRAMTRELPDGALQVASIASLVGQVLVYARGHGYYSEIGTEPHQSKDADASEVA